MRKWVVMCVAIVGVGAWFAAAPDDATACWRLRCRPVYCCPTPCPAPLAVQPAQPRAITIKGKTYYILPNAEKGENEQEEMLAKNSPFLQSAGIPESDAFTGKVRKIAKVVIFDGPTKTFDSISALRGQLLSDQDMQALGIGKGPDVDRVTKEQLNVTVNAYIYTFTKESDNDYHVILGDAPGTPNPKYMNAEVSGIPDIGTDDNRTQLWKVRKLFKQTFELADEGPDGYKPLSEPIPVKITGSLFWDVEHTPPHTVGPKFAAPKTAWEIHPISNIEFLD